MADVFLGSVYAKVELRSGDLGASVDAAKRQLDSLDKSFANASTSGGNSASRISQAFASVSDSLSGVDSMLSKITGGIVTAGAAVTGLGVASGLRLAQQLEDAKTGLSFILKSSSAAEETMARVRKEAERTPFDVGNLSKMTQQLATFTKDGSKAVDVLMAMGSATVASGADINDMQRGVINLGQAFNNAWTFADYRQMLNAIPMFKTIADEYGFTWEKMQAIQQSGTQNLGEELTKVFQDWGAKNDVFKETQNNLSQLKASFQETFTGAFYDAMKASGAIETIKDVIGKTRDGLEENKGLISDVFKSIAGLISQIDFASVFATSASMLKTFVEILKVAIDIFTGFAKVLGGGDMTKGLELMGKILIYATIGVKGIRMLSSAGSVLFGVFGKLGGGIGKVLGPLSKFSGGGAAAGGAVGSTIASILTPLGNPKVLLGAASVGIIGLSLMSLATAFNMISGMKVDLPKLGIMAIAIVVLSGMFALLGTFAAYSALGAIATAIIGVALMSVAVGLQMASDASGKINYGNLAKIGVAVAVVSLVLAAISGLAIFGAVGAIGSAIIGGGLALAALGIQAASDAGSKIDGSGLDKLLLNIAKSSLVLSSIMLLSAFAAVSSILAAVMTGGLILAAAGLLQASNIAANIKESNLDKLEKAIIRIADLNTGNIFSNLMNMLNTGVLMLTAVMVAGTAKILSSVEPVSTSKIDRLGETMKRLSEMTTGSMWSNLEKMVSSGMLAKVADNVKSVTEAFNNIQPVNKAIVQDLNEMMTELSKIKLEGGGFFDTRGGDSDKLAKIAENMNKVVTSITSIQTDGLLDKMNAFEKAISRDGKGWPENWANDFKKYIEKLSGDSKIDMVNNFINGVKGWEVGSLLDRFNQFENAVSRHGQGWPLNWAESFGAYVKALTGDGSFDMVRNFIDAVLGWNTGALLTKFNEFENAVSRHGTGWPINWAQSFGAYVKALTGDGSFEAVKSFISSVLEWNTGSLLGKFNEFENAVSRHGVGWPVNWAQSLASYLDALSGISSLDGVANFISKVLSWNTDGLLGKLNTIEDAISRHGQGWPTNWAQSFVDYWNIFSGLKYDLSNVKKMVESFTGINTEGVAQAAQAVVTMVNTVGSNVRAKASDMFSAGEALGSKVAEGLSSKNSQIAQVGRDMQGSLWNAIQGKMQDEYWQGAAMAGKFVEGLKSKNGEYYNVGVNAVQGFINGANSKSAYSTGWQIANTFLQGLKDRGKQGSPWKTTFESGVWAGEGFTNGIAKAESQAVIAARSLADSVLAEMNLDNMGTMTVKPDMSALTGSVRSLSASIDQNNVDRPNEVSIYGNISINSNATDGASLLDDLARATMLSDKGMATAV